MRHLAEAVAIFRRNPKLGKYVAQPLAWTLALFAGIALAGYFLLLPQLTGLLSRVGFERASLPIFFLLLVIVTGVSFLALAGFIGSLLWDRLSGDVERIMTGSVRTSGLTKSQLIADSVNRLIWSLVLGLLAIVSGFVLPIVGPLLVCGYIGIVDVTAPCMLKRGLLLRRQGTAIWKMKGSVELALICGAIAIIPVVNVLALPYLVAAGTVMVVRSGQ